MDCVVAILGSCGSSVDTYYTLQEVYPGIPAFFINDKPDISLEPVIELADLRIPIIRDWNFDFIRDQYPGKPIHFLCGLGNPIWKRILVSRALTHGLQPAETLISKDSIIRPKCRIGQGGVIHLGSYLSANIRIGNYISLFSARIGHDCILEDYCTCTLSNLAGHVCLDEGVQLGVGVSSRERIYVAPWSLIGIQSALVEDIETAGTVAVGIPAQEIRRVVFPNAFLASWPEGWRQHIRTHLIPIKASE